MTCADVRVHKVTVISTVSQHRGSDVASIEKGGECFGHKEESTGKEKGPSQEKGACKKESPG
jgi:hypothetical protein